MRKGQPQLIKGVKKLSRERGAGLQRAVGFSALHAELGADIEGKQSRLAELQRRAADERERMASLGTLLDPGEAGQLALLSSVEYLTDPPFLAKTAIFARLCLSQVRSLVGAVGRLGRNNARGERLADEASLRLQMYLRNVLYGDVASLSNDALNRRRSVVAVAHSQLWQDLSACTMMDIKLLRSQRPEEMDLLVAVCSQLLWHRFESETLLQVVCETLNLLSKNFAASSEMSSTGGAPTPAVGGGSNMAHFLTVEHDRLLDQLANQIEQFRARLSRTEELVDTVRVATGSFVVAVHSGQPFRLTRPAEDVVAEALLRAPRAGWQEEAEAAAARNGVEIMDPNVRFWLQREGLLQKFQDGLRGVRWDHLRQLDASELRQRGVGGGEPQRMLLLQKLLAIDETDWSPVLFSGWMRKRGEGSKAAWRRRFFVLLANVELLYFKSDSAPKPNGSLFLSHVKLVERGPGRLVSLHTPGRKYELETEPAEHAQWLCFFDTFRG